MGPRAFYMLDLCLLTELHPQPQEIIKLHFNQTEGLKSLIKSCFPFFKSLDVSVFLHLILCSTGFLQSW